MPKYRANQLGYLDDTLRRPGDVFFSTKEFDTTGKNSDLPPIPTWLTVVSDAETETNKLSAADLKKVVVDNIKSMAGLDPERKKKTWWLFDDKDEVVSVSCKELNRRASLNLNQEQADEYYKAMKRPFSGKHEIK